MLSTDDRWAINETVSLHGYLADAGLWERLEELFTADVSYDMRAVGLGVFEGIEAVRAAARQMESRGVGPIAHHVTNIVLVAIDGDSVTANSKGLMLMRDGSLESVTHGDTLRRQDGGWRISRRAIQPLPGAVPPPPEPAASER